MKRFFTSLFVLLICLGTTYSQTNIFVTNPEANDILFGNFDPADYAPSVVIDDPAEIAAQIAMDINPDSLKSYLEQMAAFGNRNTGSDTTSNTFGMGAARRWAHSKFEEFSAQNENRLIPSYLQFNQLVCNMFTHRNTFAVLPGQGDLYNEVVLIEAHFDSRCETNCDVNCEAQGMEDNGSGSALVLELARIMSQFSFDRTIVFVLTTGEEQGLWGAEAFANFCYNQGVELKAVLNNDIVGGVICGETASPPGCPGLNDVDSINVRIYSDGITNSKHKQLARFVKLEYQEMVQDLMPVQTVINIMTPEDRTGRGGDHMPFRSFGFPAIRFTSANEHGNGNPGMPDYHDRQHTMEDVLGLDTDNDGQLDSFFVDFNYLARNGVVNGNALAMAATGPVAPTNFDLEPVNNGFAISFDDPNNYGVYRIGIRKFSDNDWMTVLTTNSTIDTIYGLDPETNYVLSAATVDEDGIESLFSNEKFSAFTTGVQNLNPLDQVKLLQNNPNPFDEATVIGIVVDGSISYQNAYVSVFNLEGKELVRMPINLETGLNELEYDYRYHEYIPGTYGYSLVIDGVVVDTKKMIYAY
jgi:hypothetical protein